jgi:hypothetical protein
MESPPEKQIRGRDEDEDETEIKNGSWPLHYTTLHLRPPNHHASKRNRNHSSLCLIAAAATIKNALLTMYIVPTEMERRLQITFYDYETDFL